MKYHFAGVAKVVSRYSDMMPRLLLITFLALFILQSPLIILRSHATPPAPIPQTGQTTSYVAGDDGALKYGVPWPDPRFTDNANGTVTDNLTGLIWLKNANCFGQKTWANAITSANGLTTGTCGLTDGTIAGQCRLPTSRELKSLINRQQEGNNNNWLNTQGFNSVQASIYWSSSTYAGSTTYAWVVGISDGGGINISKTAFSYYVWPVRGGQ